MLWRQTGRPAAPGVAVPRTRHDGCPPARHLLPLLLFLTTPSPALAQIDFPALTGRVVDAADILETETERQLARQLEAHEAETTNQVVVVTLSSLQGQTIERFGQALGNHWGIGQAGRDNGVLLIVAMRDRKVRIEVGKGLERDLTDSLAQAIIEDEITPEFKRGHFEAGLYAGVDGILRAIEGSYEAPRRWNPLWILIFNPIVFILLGIASLGFLQFLFLCLVRGTNLPWAERPRWQENDEGYGRNLWSRVGSRGNRAGGSVHSYGTDYGGLSGGSSLGGGGGRFGGGGASGSW